MGQIYIIEFGSLDSAQHSKHYGQLVLIRSNRANERITSNGERTDMESLGRSECRRVAERIGARCKKNTKIKRHDERYDARYEQIIASRISVHFFFSFFFPLFCVRSRCAEEAIIRYLQLQIQKLKIQ